jgi:hypothetical protein
LVTQRPISHPALIKKTFSSRQHSQQIDHTYYLCASYSNNGFSKTIDRNSTPNKTNPYTSYLSARKPIEGSVGIPTFCRHARRLVSHEYMISIRTGPQKMTCQKNTWPMVLSISSLACALLLLSSRCLSNFRELGCQGFSSPATLCYTLENLECAGDR